MLLYLSTYPSPVRWWWQQVPASSSIRVRACFGVGVFDVRSGVAIPTPVAEYITQLSKDPSFIHPAETERGWWHQDDRFIFDRPEEELVEDEDTDECGLRGNELI